MKIKTIEEAIKELYDWGGSEYAIALIGNNMEVIQTITVAMQSIKEALDWLRPLKNEKISEGDIKKARECLSSLSDLLPGANATSNMFFDFNMVNTLLMAIGVHLRDQGKENRNKNYTPGVRKI